MNIMFTAISLEEVQKILAMHIAAGKGCNCAAVVNGAHGSLESCMAIAPRESGGAWACTRPKGHTGKHRACATMKHNCHEWEDTYENN